MVSMTWGIPCSVLPAHSTGRDALTSLRGSWASNVEDSIESRLNIYKVTPLAEHESADHILVTTPDSSFTMQHVEHLLEQRESFKMHVDRLTETLFHSEEVRKTMDRELTEARQFLAAVDKERAPLAERMTVDESGGEDRSGKWQPRDGLQSHSEKFPGEERSAKHRNDRASRKTEEHGMEKLNQMHQLNKRLREETRALKARLGQSESCRMETQKAVEHLRREFVVLVNELLPPNIRPSLKHPSVPSRDALARSERPGVGVSH